MIAHTKRYLSIISTGVLINTIELYMYNKYNTSKPVINNKQICNTNRIQEDLNGSLFIVSIQKAILGGKVPTSNEYINPKYQCIIKTSCLLMECLRTSLP